MFKLSHKGVNFQVASMAKANKVKRDIVRAESAGFSFKGDNVVGFESFSVPGGMVSVRHC